jgi:hypothetical protein
MRKGASMRGRRVRLLVRAGMCIQRQLAVRRGIWAPIPEAQHIQGERTRNINRPRQQSSGGPRLIALAALKATNA